MKHMGSENNYDKISKMYNWLSGPFENQYRQNALEAFSPVEGEQLLEIGFGTGDNLIQLSKAVGPKGHVTGIENSRKMFALSEKKVRRSGFSDRVTLLRENALSYCFPEQYYDGVFLSFTIETFNDMEIDKLLIDIRMALKPDGRLTILSMAESDKQTIIYRMYLFSHRLFPLLVDCRPINVSKLLTSNQFTLTEEKRLHTYGLPVQIATGRPL
jgi:ubiquinone/menaquinone biosynthesis C-methylase UbiE